MNVLVDSTVWSLAFRRRPQVTAPEAEAEALAELLRHDFAILLGVVRQEVLSGIKDPSAFRLLRDQLRKTPDYPVGQAHHEAAAEAYNRCRSKGVQGSLTDFLLCAVAQLDRLPILTADNDFRGYASHLPIKLYAPGA